MKEVLHTWRKPSFLRVLSSSENIFSHCRNVREVQAQEKLDEASRGRRLKSRDVSELSDKISRSRSLPFFRRLLFSRKMASYPHTHLFHGEHKTVVISGPHIQLLHSKYAMRTPFAGLSL